MTIEAKSGYAADSPHASRASTRPYKGDGVTWWEGDSQVGHRFIFDGAADITDI